MKWFEKYPLLSSYNFNYDNSGRSNGKSKIPIIDEIEKTEYTILGYSLDLPFYPKYKSVGILFENKDTFETIWFHYVYENDVIVDPIKINKNVRFKK